MQLSRHHPVKAACWMFFGVLSFICLAVAVRQLIYDYSAYQILGIRSMLGTLFLSLLILKKNRSWYISLTPGRQIARNLVHFTGQYLWVIGIGLLPLAEVFALEFTAPAWAALLACLFLGERLTFARKVALACGFTGLLMILKPGPAIFQSASMIVIISALFFAMSMILVKQLSKTDNAATILFYFCLIQTPLGLIPASFDWTPVTAGSLIWFVLAGICGLTAHLGITKAVQNADVMFIQPVDFLRVPLVALVGYVFYEETIDIWLIIGAVIIFSGNLYSLKQEVKPKRFLRDST